VRSPRNSGKTVQVSYALEYGGYTGDHEDAVQKGQRVLVCDDLLATGEPRRRRAAHTETRRQVDGAAFAVELSFLNGRSKLPGLDVFSLIQYDK